MKKIYFIIICLLFLISNIKGQFYAVYIPEDKIKIDGDLEDWSWVPEKYFIETNLMNNVAGQTEVDEKNWKCKIIVGWNDIKNWLYIAAVVHDDSIIINHDGSWHVDRLIVSVNPDNVGGFYSYKKWDRYYHIINGFSVIDKANKINDFGIFSGPSWLENNPQYLKSAGKIVADDSNGTQCMIYEVGMSLWNRWDPNFIQLSKRHYLSPGQVIRLSITFRDYDNAKGAGYAKWSTSATSDWDSDGDYISQFILVPPSNSEISWDGINQLLKQ